MMPVSTPKVLVRPQGQRQYEWVDLWESYVSQLNADNCTHPALTAMLGSCSSTSN